eukprot:scaffold31902_cov43-Cyclotella_meneghiniana.AAC.2
MEEVADSSLDSSNEAEFDRMVQLALAPLEQHEMKVNVSLEENAPSISFNEAEFRRKAWLALAPLYDGTSTNSNSGDITMACNQDTDTKILESERSAELGINEADAKTDDTSKPFRFVKRTVEILNKWFADHEAHPYPTNEERQELALATGLKKNQVIWWMGVVEIIRKGPLKLVRKWFIKERHLKGKSKSTAVHSPHLKIWFAEHESHPYPTKDQRAELALITGLTEDQVRNWFNRERYLKGKSNTREYNRLSSATKDHLMQWYEENEAFPYPSKDKLTELALVSGMTENRVRNWFRNERMKRKSTCKNLTKYHLMQWYDKNEANPYPSKEELTELALVSGMTEKCVRVWFGNERMKRKKAANGTITSGEPESKA